MATQSLTPAKYVGDLDGGSASIRIYPEASSQSFSAGCLVYLASGSATVCADDATTVMGMALDDASGTANTDIPVLVLTPTSLLSLATYHTTSASAITAITSVGLKYPIELDSAKHYIEVTNQSNACVVVIDIDKTIGLAVGDMYGRYICTVMAANLQSTIGA